MGKTVIDSLDKKSQIVKKIMAGTAIDGDHLKKHSTEAYREKLMKVSVWSDDDVNALKDAGASIKFKPNEW